MESFPIIFLKEKINKRRTKMNGRKNYENEDDDDYGYSGNPNSDTWISYLIDENPEFFEDDED